MKDIIKYYKENIKRCLKDYKDRKTIIKQIPNLLTVYRILSIIPFNIAFFTGNIPISLGILSTAFISDFFDGRIARKYNISTKFGADLDAISDKLLLVGTIIPTIVSNKIVLLNLLMEGVIASINISRKIKGNEPKTIKIGKIKTFLLSATIIMSYLNLYFDLNLVMPYLIGSTLIVQGITSYKYYQKSKSDSILTSKEDEKNHQIKEVENEKNIKYNYSYDKNHLPMVDSIDKVKVLKKK